MISAVLLALAAAGCTDTQRGVTSAVPALSDVTMANVIALPDGFWPEGIDFGRGTTFYVGSLATGAIWRGDARTGAGAVLVPEQPGVEKVGIRYDARRDRLFVAGGFTGQAFVYDASTGALLASYQLAELGMSLINDVALTSDGVYFTDSFNPVLYRLPVSARGTLPAEDAVETIPLSGDFVFIPDTPIGNANGIAATPDGKRLIIVNTTTGELYLVDPATGVTTAIDLGGEIVSGDGILLEGRTLYVVQGHLNEITVIRLGADMTSGVIVGALTDDQLRFPSTIARFGNALYAVNARFDVEPGPTVAYEVVRVAR
jgi:sugar lactone lactonase YvrE